MNNTLLQFLKKIAKQPAVNHFLRRFVPPFLRRKFPAYGVLSVKLSPGKHFKILTDPRDALGRLLYYYGLKQYEPEVLPLFRRLLRQARVFIDIGAHTGLYSLIAAAENPCLAVHAFEPVPEIFAYLSRNIQANRFETIFAYQEALTNYDGPMELYVPACDGIPMVASANKNFRSNTQAVPVKAMRLDSFVSRHSIPRVDLIKVDTETTEIQVLEGAQKTISRDRPIIFCEVLAKTEVSRLNQFFEDKDYRYCLLTDQGVIKKYGIENHEKFWNHLFVPAERWNQFSYHANVSIGGNT